MLYQLSYLPGFLNPKMTPPKLQGCVISVLRPYRMFAAMAHQNICRISLFGAGSHKPSIAIRGNRFYI